MKPISKAKLFGFTGVALLLFSAITLYFCEAGLRLIYHRPQLIGNCYPLGPSIGGAHIHMVQREYTIDLDFNSQGFRDKEFNISPQPAQQRILFLGDSFVEGTGVSVDQRASSIIEKALVGHFPNLSVLNAGQLDTGPLNYFDNFTRFGAALKPTVIVLGIYLGNDFQGNGHLPIPKNYTVLDKVEAPVADSAASGFALLRYTRSWFHQGWNGKTYLVRFINTDRFWDLYTRKSINRNFFIRKSGLPQKRYAELESLYSKDVLEDFYTGRLNPVYLLGALASHQGNGGKGYDETDVASVLEAVTVIRRESARRGIKFLCVVYPDLSQVAPGVYSDHLLKTVHMKEIPKAVTGLGPLRGQFTGGLERQKVPFLDLTPSLSLADYYLFDGHLNPRGQAKAGDLITSQLMTMM